MMFKDPKSTKWAVLMSSGMAEEYEIPGAKYPSVYRYFQGLEPGIRHYKEVGWVEIEEPEAIP